MPFVPNYLSLTDLESLPLFRELTPLQLESAQCVIRRHEYGPDQLVMEQNQTSDFLFLIIEGTLKISTERSHGEVILALHGRGELLGERSILEHSALAYSVTTLTDCVLGAVSRFDFWNILWEMPVIPYNLACLLEERVSRLSRQNQAFALLDIQSRLAQQLVLLSEEHGYELPNDGREIPFRLTQEEWAQLVGASRAQINQILMKWRRQGWIEVQPDRILLHQLTALQSVYNEFSR